MSKIMRLGLNLGITFTLCFSVTLYEVTSCMGDPPCVCTIDGRSFAGHRVCHPNAFDRVLGWHDLRSFPILFLSAMLSLIDRPTFRCFRVRSQSFLCMQWDNSYCFAQNNRSSRVLSSNSGEEKQQAPRGKVQPMFVTLASDVFISRHLRRAWQNLKKTI